MRDRGRGNWPGARLGGRGEMPMAGRAVARMLAVVVVVASGGWPVVAGRLSLLAMVAWRCSSQVVRSQGGRFGGPRYVPFGASLGIVCLLGLFA